MYGPTVDSYGKAAFVRRVIPATRVATHVCGMSDAKSGNGNDAKQIPRPLAGVLNTDSCAVKAMTYDASRSLPASVFAVEQSIERLTPRVNI